MNRAYRTCRNSCGGSSAPTLIDLKIVPMRASVNVTSIQCVWHPHSFRALILYAWNYCTCWNPLWRKFSHQLEWILNRCRNQLGCICSPFEVFALGFVLCLGFTIPRVMALSEPVDEASLAPTWTDLKCVPK